MKPIHEQKWEAVPTAGDIRHSERIVAVVVHEEDDQALSAFIAKAPQMAARLREIHRVPANGNGDVVISGEFVDLIGDLLREAGVNL
jgi:hypothetical protein